MDEWLFHHVRNLSDFFDIVVSDSILKKHVFICIYKDSKIYIYIFIYKNYVHRFVCIHTIYRYMIDWQYACFY